MKKLLFCLSLAVVIASMAHPAGAYQFRDDFSTAWTGNYAPGWESEGYRWGTAPIATMEQTTAGARTGVKVTVDSVASSGQFWGIVSNTLINTGAMEKQFNPYMKVSYYDDGGAGRGGQLYTVPTTSYQPQADDWTDTQLGSRLNRTDNYYYVAAQPANNPGWQNTGVTRTLGWHELMIRLSSIDGLLRFYIDGTQVGVSGRNDYTNLGTVMLGTMFTSPLSDWGANKPYAIFGSVEAGSSSPVPIPAAIWLLGAGLLGLLGVKRKIRK